MHLFILLKLNCFYQLVICPGERVVLFGFYLMFVLTILRIESLPVFSNHIHWTAFQWKQNTRLVAGNVFPLYDAFQGVLYWTNGADYFYWQCVQAFSVTMLFSFKV